MGRARQDSSAIGPNSEKGHTGERHVWAGCMKAVVAVDETKYATVCNPAYSISSYSTKTRRCVTAVNGTFVLWATIRSVIVGTWLTTTQRPVRTSSSTTGGQPGQVWASRRVATTSLKAAVIEGHCTP